MFLFTGDRECTYAITEELDVGLSDTDDFSLSSLIGEVDREVVASMLNEELKDADFFPWFGWNKVGGVVRSVDFELGCDCGTIAGSWSTKVETWK